MRFFQSLMLIGLIVFGCQPKTDFQVQRYFQLDSLLLQQGQLLAERNVVVLKRVSMNEESEETTFQPDTSRWKREFQLIEDFSLNKTNYIGAFNIEKSPQSETYEKKAGQPIAINKFSVKYEKQLASVSGQYFEDKDIFQHERNFTLNFDDQGILSTYRIWGFQKMMLQDTIKYDIVGKVQIPK